MHMGRRRRASVAQLFGAKPSDAVVGSRYIRVLDQYLDSLHQRQRHPNRSLFYDHVVIAHLLAFFNPALRGLRSIGELFDDPGVRKRFSSPRVPKSTLSDAQELFDPGYLIPLICNLRKRVKLSPHDSRLDDLTQRLLAVDGTFFTVAPRIAWALFNQNDRPGKQGSTRKGGIRLHTQFDILQGVPHEITLTAGNTQEHRELRRHLQPHCFYVLDRGFLSFELLEDIVGHHSDFVTRLRGGLIAQTIDRRPLTAADQAAGVVEDAVVELGWRADRRLQVPQVRRVTIRFTDRNGKQVELVLLTNRMDLPAHLIGLIYQHRWQVELFFRWLKCLAHFEHFFSESREGMTLQVYVTIIGTLLIALTVGTKPSKYDYTLMSCALLGWTSIEYVQQAAAKRAAARQKAARKTSR
jgi:hypothetical protein